MRKKILCWYLAAAVLGTGWHFLYSLLPLPLIGLIAPINESVWEHLKLLFWPFWLAAPALAQMAPRRQQGWGGCFAALLLMPVLLLMLYYPVTAGFGVTTEVFSIGLYYVVLAAGVWTALRFGRTAASACWAGVLLMGVGFYCACLIVFSLASPALPIFRG